jgi:hypothetical protein
MGEGDGNGESVVRRTVVCEHAAQNAIDGCASEFQRGQEICDAMMDLVSRLPTIGVRVPGTNPLEFVVRSDEWPYPDMPVVTMHYRWEADDTITLLNVRYHDA